MESTSTLPHALQNDVIYPIYLGLIVSVMVRTATWCLSFCTKSACPRKPQLPPDAAVVVAAAVDMTADALRVLQPPAAPSSQLR
ncbi:unnamed protein product [Schistocephalus solidus]|uniref:Secreted protein n=1 Tax=Schistocephalus solidus TaxID=70667 RepID=A0A183TUJ7_SCHSO|nr:unnamed protein product [Schistocephalus solidus]